MPSADTDRDRDFDVSRHVLGQLGLRLREDADGERHIDLELAGVHLGGDGHVDFGVLGVFLDLAASQPPEMRRVGPWLHADITIHRLRPPRGSRLRTAPRMVRMGRRTGIVEIEVHDDAGTHVARSVQELVFPQGASTTEVHDDGGEAREAFLRAFRGTCRLAGPLPEVLAIARGVDDDGRAGWSLPLSDLARNGFGGLHGGVATSLVDTAAADAVRERTGAAARTLHAAVRYLAPGREGPFLAVPRVVGLDGSVATVVVEVRDTGADGRLIILADAVVALDGEGGGDAPGQ